MFKRLAAFILAFLLLISATPVSAQTATPPPGPVYIVQAGDTLWDIASRFDVSVADLESINNLPTTNIFAGDKLVIPGLAGLSGTLITQPVPFGETLPSLSRQYRMDQATLEKINHIVSPSELYVGYGLIILEQDNQPPWTSRANLGQGETMLELAVKGDSDPWTVAQINGLADPPMVCPGIRSICPPETQKQPPPGCQPRWSLPRWIRCRFRRARPPRSKWSAPGSEAGRPAGGPSIALLPHGCQHPGRAARRLCRAGSGSVSAAD